MPSSSPTAEFTFGARVFNEPLIPVGSDPTAAENAALSTALQEYTQRPDRDDFSSVTAFLTAHPRSPWALPLMLNLGLAYFHSGHYSKALGVWEDAWDLAKLVTARAAQPLTDRIVGELAYMYARLGRKDDLQILLDSLADHVFSGPATELICGAREGLWTMNMRPDVAFRCGPLALHRIKQSVDPHNPRTDVINATASTPKGFNLHQVAKLSGKLGLDYQMAFRAQHASIIVPSVAHFRLDHFAAVIRQEGDLYLLEDPTFGGNVMATGAALDEETSGYFLIPQGDLPRGWRAVDAHEGEQVWGKGVTTSNDPKPHGPCDPHTSGQFVQQGQRRLQGHGCRKGALDASEPEHYRRARRLCSCVRSRGPLQSALQPARGSSTVDRFSLFEPRIQMDVRLAGLHCRQGL